MLWTLEWVLFDSLDRDKCMPAEPQCLSDSDVYRGGRGLYPPIRASSAAFSRARQNLNRDLFRSRSLRPRSWVCIWGCYNILLLFEEHVYVVLSIINFPVVVEFIRGEKIVVYLWDLVCTAVLVFVSASSAVVIGPRVTFMAPELKEEESALFWTKVFPKMFGWLQNAFGCWINSITNSVNET